MNTQELIFREYLKTMMLDLAAQKFAFQTKDYELAEKILDSLTEETAKWLDKYKE